MSRVPTRHPDVAIRGENQMVEAGDRLEQFLRLGTEANQLFLEGADATGADGVELMDGDTPIKTAPPAADRQDAEEFPRTLAYLVQLVLNRLAGPGHPESAVI